MYLSAMMWKPHTLMLEASHALGLKNDTLTKIIGKRMVDHALKKRMG